MSSIGGVGGFRPPPPGKPPSFEKMDGNSDGALSLDEFKAGAPKGADSSKSEELFKKIDADGDGSISKAESDEFKSKAEKADQQLQSFLFQLQSAGTSQTEETDEDEEQDPFAQLDGDSDGTVTEQEFLKTLSSDDSSTNDLLSKLFAAIDSDSDGSLSKDEIKSFQEAVEKRGPPPPPPPRSEASQAYGSTSQLGATASAGSTYSQAA